MQSFQWVLYIYTVIVSGYPPEVRLLVALMPVIDGAVKLKERTFVDIWPATLMPSVCPVLPYDVTYAEQKDKTDRVTWIKVRVKDNTLKSMRL